MADHARGCQGREYVCTCGYGEENDKLISDLLSLAYQYRDDLRYPPGLDSRERRFEAIDAVISKAEGRS